MRYREYGRPDGSSVTAILGAGLALLLFVPVFAKVTVQHDRETDFSVYTNYCWGKGTPARRPGVQDLIVAAVDRELAARGLSRVDGGAELVVLTHALVDEHTLAELADPTYFKFWSGVNVVDPTTLKTGSLVVDLQDAGSERIIWRGLATATIDNSFKKIGRKIDKEVARMFRQFPPAKPLDGQK